jgi:6-pyruvoyltetrahydropterin/6-carboxytetrahydropterin synthase
MLYKLEPHPDRSASRERGRLSLSKEFMFEAAHVLPKHKGKCSSLHGHSWKLTVEVDGYVDPETGFVVDYSLLKSLITARIIDKVDHAYLGCRWLGRDVDNIHITPVYGEDFYPSSENLIERFRTSIQHLIPELAEPWQEVKLLSLTINETCTSACTWRRPNV